ncbi:FAD-dependent oxidoreductase [Bradyrhizobium sp. LHD-71]|uniref:protoporphyrinogen/coproporphyrinogen oxidase n=1 Tax=Bradyrhizobium sp. LHD-71 TaxID=3072141 RepID=UPI00280E6510|nr:FAD-dependent oxidoreductase [Bradyrhizobium sp. LHD-71]MDQ8727664.1 FAD-dependent oxidoreductase [Bradyrhizobium sp. LHD-71]
MEDRGFAILGSGMAGFGAANLLYSQGIRPKLYELRARPGGLTSSFNFGNGFVFDEGIHISFSKHDDVKRLFAESTQHKYETGQVYCNNYWKGHWIKHPAQVNLHGLPTDLVIACIGDFIEASKIENPIIKNYQDWLLAAFGRTFAETFPMVYTRKYHTTDAANMSTDWLGPRLYRPKLEEMLRGALEHEPLDVFYVNEFRYPTEGGFESFIKGFYAKAEVHCDHEVTRIDMRDKALYFKNGTRASFENLISSIPLPKLVPLIVDAPTDVREAASRLACTQFVVVNIGLSRPLDMKPQWSYFYDEDIPFARVSYRGNLSSRNVPPGCDALQAEIYFSEKYRPLQGPPDDWIEPTIDALIKCGIVANRDEVIHKSTIWSPFGNVIFDLDRAAAVNTVHGFLRDIGINYCGRFGEWGYIWTDHAFMSGENAAKAALRAHDRETATLETLS